MFLPKGYEAIDVTAVNPLIPYIEGEASSRLCEWFKTRGKNWSECIIATTSNESLFNFDVHLLVLFQGRSRKCTFYIVTPALVWRLNPPLRFCSLTRDCLVRCLRKKAWHFISIIPDGNFLCHNCVHCYAMIRGNSPVHPHLGEMIKVSGRITGYVVYLLKCSFYYVGKTKSELNTRICEHKSSICNHDEKSPVARHFNSHNHELSALLS